MKKIIIFLFIFISVFTFLFVPTKEVFAAGSLSLSPATGGGAVDSSFVVVVKLDTGGAATTGVDMILTFSPQYLEVAGFNPGILFAGYTNPPTIDGTIGKIVYHPNVTSTVYAYTSPTGSPGTLATITFKGKAAGTAPVAFTCTPGTSDSDSNIWSSGVDIINCGSTSGGSYTITSAGGGTQATSTPIPTSGSGVSSPTPATQLLESGVTEWTFLIFALGIFFILGGAKLLLAKTS